MEINEKHIIKGLECCTRGRKSNEDRPCLECPYNECNLVGGTRERQTKGTCQGWLMKDALALINSQEQKIFELENRLKECENGYEGTLHLESCKLHDAEEKVKELTQSNEQLSESYDELEKIKDELLSERSRLILEIERLRGILLEFTDIVHKWGNKNGYDTSEISLVSILNEESEIKKQIREETVKKMQSAIKEYYSKSCYRPTKENPVKHTQVEHLLYIIDGIAKNISEGKNGL